jgi:hypothetical protein
MKIDWINCQKKGNYYNQKGLNSFRPILHVKIANILRPYFSKFSYNFFAMSRVFI